jgi:hypothetical protein
MSLLKSSLSVLPLLSMVACDEPPPPEAFEGDEAALERVIDFDDKTLNEVLADTSAYQANSDRTVRVDGKLIIALKSTSGLSPYTPVLWATHDTVYECDEKLTSCSSLAIPSTIEEWECHNTLFGEQCSCNGGFWDCLGMPCKGDPVIWPDGTETCSRA